ncbi:MAG TPA: ribosome small subunit-dependent GTPase A [Oscillospiraceae bacterium]|nr:ribosome small subunit-dependent GTPase A [Oscillospiraceae bacterium]HPS35104.1 ribosome small subunit-dependent GTPase A [Oscillospiraceae bacterium]
MTEGLVLKCVGGLYSVLCGENTVNCKARGLFRKDNFAPTAGDRVLIDSEGAAPVLAEVLPRRNLMLRPFVANVDRMLAVASVKEPNFNVGLLDKMLAVAAANGIACAVVITKDDLASAEQYVRLYSNAGYPSVSLCGKDSGEARELEKLLVLGINLLSGNSGVGKTTLLNSFAGMARKTDEISKALGRGKHTTREAELFEISKGVFICDTPGFSSVNLETLTPDISLGQLADCFLEFAKKKDDCRFADCRHINEPGCAVRAAVKNGEIALSRYESYKLLYEEVSSIKKY